MPVVLPGDDPFTSVSLNDTSAGGAPIRLGPGIIMSQEQASGASAVKAGVVRRAKQGGFWIEQDQKRYIPALNDPVVGVVSARTAEFYRVDIGGPHPATLGSLAFDGATKRNKPNLEPGSLVYARVTLANKDMEPELDCTNSNTSSSSSSSSSGFGELAAPLITSAQPTPLHYTTVHRTSSLFLARSLLLTSSSGGGEGGHVLLQSVGKLFGFEVAIGVNGWIWIKAERPQHVVLIVMALKEMESCEIGYFLPQQQQQKKNDGGDEEEDETTNDNDMDLDKSPPSSSHHDRLKSWEASVRRIVSKLTKQLEEASSTT